MHVKQHLLFHHLETGVPCDWEPGFVNKASLAHSPARSFAYSLAALTHLPRLYSVQIVKLKSTV